VKSDTAWSEVGCKKDLCSWSFATQDRVVSIIFSSEVNFL